MKFELVFLYKGFRGVVCLLRYGLDRVENEGFVEKGDYAVVVVCFTCCFFRLRGLVEIRF